MPAAKTKKEICKALRDQGKRSRKCNHPPKVGIRKPSGLPRPVGNPIDRCTVKQEDLEYMTIKQIINFSRRQKIPVALVNDQGRPLRKAELIHSVLSKINHAECRASSTINPKTASIRQLGLELKYRGLPIPAKGDSSCPTDRVCKEQLKKALDKVFAESPAVYKKEKKEEEEVKRPTAKNVKRVRFEDPVQMKPLTYVEVRPEFDERMIKPERSSPTVNVQITTKEKVIPIAGVQVDRQTGETKLAQGTMKPLKDFLNNTEKFQFEMRTAEGSQYHQELYNNNETKYIINSSCLATKLSDTDDKPSAIELSANNDEFFKNHGFYQMIYRTCKQVNGEKVCDKSIVDIIELLNDSDIAEWTAYAKQYIALSNYSKTLPKPIALNWTAAWTCGTDVDISYKTGWILGEKVKRAKRHGFFTADVPENYNLVTWKELTQFLTVVSRKTPAEIARIMETNILTLAGRLQRSGYVPKRLIPEEIMFLVSDDTRVINAVLMPVPWREMVPFHTFVEPYLDIDEHKAVINKLIEDLPKELDMDTLE